jgi:hypothetical protein
VSIILWVLILKFFCRVPLGPPKIKKRSKQVAVVKLSGEVKEGDIILIEGGTKLFTQDVKFMEIDDNEVDRATGRDVGIKLESEARLNDKVFKIIVRLSKK